MNEGSVPSRVTRPQARPKRHRQRTYYLAAEYSDQGDRLLVDEGDRIELYSLDLRLAQHWYADAWRGRRFDTSPFNDQLLDGASHLSRLSVWYRVGWCLLSA